MTDQDRFLETINAAHDSMPGWHLVCADCPKDDCEDCEACANTGEFSWLPCELCESTLGGSRHALTWIKPGEDVKPIYISACFDCVYFVANGELPEQWE